MGRLKRQWTNARRVDAVALNLNEVYGGARTEDEVHGIMGAQPVQSSPRCHPVYHPP